MNKKMLLKVICFGAPVATFLLGQALSWATEENQKDYIDEKINEAVAAREKEES